jgi:hypothetical protein
VIIFVLNVTHVFTHRKADDSNTFDQQLNIECYLCVAARARAHARGMCGLYRRCVIFRISTHLTGNQGKQGERQLCLYSLATSMLDVEPPPPPARTAPAVASTIASTRSRQRAAAASSWAQTETAGL